MRDYDREIEELKARVERAEDGRNNYERLYETAKAELDELREAVSITTEKLGHSGHEAEDLHDAVGTIERLVEGKDVDCGLEYEGLAAKIEDRVKRPSLPPGYSLHGTAPSLHLRHHGERLEFFADEPPNAYLTTEEAHAFAWDHWEENHASSEWCAFVGRARA